MLNSKIKSSEGVAVKAYLRPLKLGILLSVIGELIIFLIWGVYLYPQGDILYKFLWTVVFCGVGMGSAIGVSIVLIVVPKFSGYTAIILTTLISLILLGLLCNLLCFRLDISFDFFGGRKTPHLFLWNGVVMSVIGGLSIGWLCFTDVGNNILEKFKM
ncbi:MAG: hypothetical protein JJ975_00900 [Bacteroidia bacterium]|nr:hypothetical protein [Bacteroidia bacterium]